MRKVDNSELRVTIVAMTARYGSAPYVQMLPEAVSKHANVSLVAPEHFNDPVVGIKHVRFRTGPTPSRTLRQNLKPWSHVDLLLKVRNTKPDVVHILNGYGYPWALTLAGFLPPVPVVTTLHDPTPHPGNKTDAVQRVLGRFTLARSTGIHIHDQMFMTDLTRRFPGKPVFIIRHPSFASRYLKHAQPNVTRTRSVLFFGRIEYYKGIDVLLSAAALLPTDVMIIVAGAGALSQAEQKLAAALGPRLTMLNRFIEDHEVALLLQQAGVLALPYLQATQSSLPLISAAFALPVVATSVGTFTTEIPRLGGVLVPPAIHTPCRLRCCARSTRHKRYKTIRKPFDDLALRFLDMYRKVATQCR